MYILVYVGCCTFAEAALEQIDLDNINLPFLDRLDTYYIGCGGFF